MDICCSRLNNDVSGINDNEDHKRNVADKERSTLSRLERSGFVTAALPVEATTFSTRAIIRSSSTSPPKDEAKDQSSLDHEVIYASRVRSDLRLIKYN